MRASARGNFDTLYIPSPTYKSLKLPLRSFQFTATGIPFSWVHLRPSFISSFLLASSTHLTSPLSYLIHARWSRSLGLHNSGHQPNEPSLSNVLTQMSLYSYPCSALQYGSTVTWQLKIRIWSSACHCRWWRVLTRRRISGLFRNPKSIRRGTSSLYAIYFKMKWRQLRRLIWRDEVLQRWGLHSDGSWFLSPRVPGSSDHERHRRHVGLLHFSIFSHAVHTLSWLFNPFIRLSGYIFRRHATLSALRTQKPDATTIYTLRHRRRLL